MKVKKNFQKELKRFKDLAAGNVFIDTYERVCIKTHLVEGYALGSTEKHKYNTTILGAYMEEDYAGAVGFTHDDALVAPVSAELTIGNPWQSKE